MIKLDIMQRHKCIILLIMFEFILKIHACIADSSRKLTLLYVANDVIQNSKRKGTEYRGEFLKVLPRALQMISK